ncbi:hypothetical protein DPEC_G00303310 [Dallia pectoralis]|uniref:Uncharacterized protein n=1 Tax=Dallia pectoralis TaxID=75939 RepID=A0ACC2FD69_DALPE|nr:hypothetical protein DPEC_G00303310 [Dallia pectoralis]
MLALPCLVGFAEADLPLRQRSRNEYKPPPPALLLLSSRSPRSAESQPAVSHWVVFQKSFSHAVNSLLAKGLIGATGVWKKWKLCTTRNDALGHISAAVWEGYQGPGWGGSGSDTKRNRTGRLC